MKSNDVAATYSLSSSYSKVNSKSAVVNCKQNYGKRDYSEKVSNMNTGIVDSKVSNDFQVPISQRPFCLEKVIFIFILEEFVMKSIYYTN